jgi:hypothetical protein
MKPSKKVQKKLERRQKGHQQIIEENKNRLRFNPAAYRVPGSRNQKK